MDDYERLDPVCLENNYDIYNLTETYAESLVKDRTEIVIKLYVLPCILALGLLGNLVVFCVVASVRSMRTITNFYLVNIAVADLIFLTVGVGEKLWRYNVSPVNNDLTPMGSMGCVFFLFVVDCTHTASILLVTTVTIERYYAICKPLWHRRIATWQRTVKLVIASWTISLILSAILIPGHYTMNFVCHAYPSEAVYDDFPSVYGNCHSITEWFVDFANGIQVIPFFTAMFINSILYTLIIKQLSARVNTDITKHSDRYRLTHARNSVSRMLVITGVVFFLCLFPFQVLSLSMMVAGFIGDEAYQKVEAIVMPHWPIFQALMYVNSAVNAYIYIATNERYRRAVVEAFTCSLEQERVACCFSMKSSTRTISELVNRRDKAHL